LPFSRARALEPGMARTLRLSFEIILLARLGSLEVDLLLPRGLVYTIRSVSAIWL
jgi:hypothetical protein